MLTLLRLHRKAAALQYVKRTPRTFPPWNPAPSVGSQVRAWGRRETLEASLGPRLSNDRMGPPPLWSKPPGVASGP